MWNKNSHDNGGTNVVNQAWKRLHNGDTDWRLRYGKKNLTLEPHGDKAIHVFSYDALIAVLHIDGFALYNDDSYSSTTSSHQSLVRRDVERILSWVGSSQNPIDRHLPVNTRHGPFRLLLRASDYIEALNCPEWSRFVKATRYKNGLLKLHLRKSMEDELLPDYLRRAPSGEVHGFLYHEHEDYSLAWTPGVNREDESLTRLKSLHNQRGSSMWHGDYMTRNKLERLLKCESPEETAGLLLNHGRFQPNTGREKALRRYEAMHRAAAFVLMGMDRLHAREVALKAA